MTTWVPVIAALLAAFAALTVPRVTFKLALRQDDIRWHRDQRAQLYVDLLVEAYAEKKHLEYEVARENLGPHYNLSWYTDLRLPPADRTRLGARAAMFAGSEVLRHFDTIAAGFGATPQWGTLDLDTGAMVKTTEALDALEKAIRAEMPSTDGKMRP